MATTQGVDFLVKNYYKNNKYMVGMKKNPSHEEILLNNLCFYMCEVGVLYLLYIQSCDTIDRYIRQIQSQH